jgi:epoxyqueuosine reductase
MTPRARSELIKRLAADIGFDRAVIAAAGSLPRATYYRRWLAAGHAGTMNWLADHSDIRENPLAILPGARSIICVALSYHRPEAEENVPGSGSEPTGRVARYARGRDYHVVVRKRLDELRRRIRAELGEPFESRVFADACPLDERQLAAAAGLGWVGKNTLVLHPRLGSYFFLGELVTTLDLDADAPATDHCGTCTRCIDACPTQALTAYRMDASRCISYLTIEHRGPIDAELAGKMGDWVFGCDICQEVCPFNSRAPLARDPELLEKRTPPRMPLGPLVTLTHGDHRRLTKGAATRRASRDKWRRNARIALENSQDHTSANSASTNERGSNGSMSSIDSPRPTNFTGMSS